MVNNDPKLICVHFIWVYICRSKFLFAFMKHTIYIPILIQSPYPDADGGGTIWQALEFKDESEFYHLWKYNQSAISHIPSTSSLLLDFAGFVQFISHRARDLPPGGSLLPHTLLLLSPWWPERGIGGGGGGWRWQHGSRLQREEGEGYLLCHVGGSGSCHAVLVRRKIHSLSPTELLSFWQSKSRF